MRILLILSVFFVACLPPKALPKKKPDNEAFKLKLELDDTEEKTKILNTDLQKAKEENSRLNSSVMDLTRQLSLQKKSCLLDQAKLKKQISKMRRPIVVKEVAAPTNTAPTVAVAPTPVSESASVVATPTAIPPEQNSSTEYSPSDAP